MALAIVQVKHDGKSGVVTLQSNKEDGSLAIQELQHGSARHMAVQAAAEKGLPNPACEMPGSPYAVDDKGVTVGNPKEQVPAAYRVDIPVTTRVM